MKKTTISAIAAVSVVGALVIGLGAVSSWFTNWNVKTWFGRGGGTQTEQPEKPDIPDDNKGNNSEQVGGAEISDGKSNGIRILSAKLPRAAYAANGISEQADTAYTLTATVMPDSANDLSIEWSVAWVNSDSAFATGKDVTDYVAVTSTGLYTANIVCHGAFGEPINVVATSKDNPDVSAVCRVDYRKRIYFVLGGTMQTTFISGSGTNTYSHNYDEPFSYVMNYTQYDCYASGLSFNPVYKDYTVDDSFTCTVTRELTDDFYSNLKLNVTELQKSVPLAFNNGFAAFDSIQFLSHYGVSSSKLGTSTIQNIVVTDLKMLNGAAHELLRVHYESDYSSYDQVFELRFNPATLVTRVTSLSLDKSNIIV